ncbi:MAG: hypothetical protein DDT40_01306 [candidate division WS2 bacterium]|uniref:N-acetyltransferase domain-containing protein n=1 Tax=Psychracetigena formicireducens TaxID=2986056 RepID=A0A9E2BHI4_PSYF1|nr:hypothetical protein [Candidatus Psychracetigena formicireducens]MBT9145637.1 hypothetical protein [Candidatus Psychracetigena formicireducens]MBT9151121.1 hypothetical protein [Candidatus Psychracetigena formicireducens]
MIMPPKTINIIDLKPENKDHIEQTAELLFEGFKTNWPEAWPDISSALTEVNEAINDENRINRIAINQQGLVMGWIGGISLYRGRVWEIHPLVVHIAHQGKGIGRLLIIDLEKQASIRGGLTLFAGSDDENYMTSLSGCDLYPEVLKHLSFIKNLKGHPYEFYLKLGFTIVGCLPDANGPGKPDIYLAKRIGKF